MNFYQQTIEAVFDHFKVDEKQGLSGLKVKKALKIHGKNELPRARKKTTNLKIFLNQWKSPLLFILLVAGFISGLLGEYTDMTVILLTAGINAAIGYIQENKANSALEKLQEMVAYQATVMRDGKKLQIESSNLVPGDILFLEAGDKIQADARIISTVDFEVHEAALTGESQEVKKSRGVIKDEIGVADRYNTVFRGTTAVNGHAVVVVINTGEETEIGKIATMVKDIKDEETPLQNQLKKLSQKLGAIVLVISFLIFLLGIFVSKDTTIFEMFETAVAISVAAIPEGLIISLTVILAIGMQFILKRNALVRRLVSAETLGSVSVICTDKTGTVTEGKMSVTELVTKSEHLDVDELRVLNSKKEDRHAEALLALRIGTLCNNASQNSENIFVGDTTETALAEIGFSAGINKVDLEKTVRRIDEIPFSSREKYMVTLHHASDAAFIYAKGAPEVILSKCSYLSTAGGNIKLEKKEKDWLEDEIRKLTAKGLRVLALAYKGTDLSLVDLGSEDEENLTFAGIVGLSDPVRTDVKQTIEVARQAGIRVIMVTGDHAMTARAIASQIGLPSDDQNVVRGDELQKMSEKKLLQVVTHASVFARVDPRDKIRIVNALKKNGEVVAMTGDGVNDAPALKGADIGVAVGSGTDVAKEVAELVILDDKFPTIVAAVEEGRTIYQNIKKVVLKLLSDSFTEVILISGSLIAGLPLALLPVQILWVNLIEDSFPNMALAFDKGDKENMKDPPRKKGVSLIDKEMKVMIAIVTIVHDIGLLTAYIILSKIGMDIALVRTIIFAALATDSLIIIYPIRSMRHMLWQINPFDNRYLTMSVLLGLGLLILSIYAQPLQYLLKTIPLTAEHWLLVILLGIIDIILIEAIKGIFLVKNHHKLSE
ncbi:MAG: HAD-IC family P-type ATPase [Candidatus Magasanikbacteria bacterium]